MNTEDLFKEIDFEMLDQDISSSPAFSLGVSTFSSPQSTAIDFYHTPKSDFNNDNFSSNFLLTYEDAMFGKNELDILTHNGWINDNIIHFYFAFLEKQLKSLLKETFYLVRPAMCHLLVNSTLPLPQSVAPEEMKNAKFVFIPVNNNEFEYVGGSHWSLLIYRRDLDAFYHFDSLLTVNLAAAMKTKRNITRFLSNTPNFENDMNFFQVSCNVQGNSYDCGIYVLAITEVILGRLLNQSMHLSMNPANLTFWIQTSLDGTFITSKRVSIHQQMEQLFKAEVEKNNLVGINEDIDNLRIANNIQKQNYNLKQKENIQSFNTEEKTINNQNSYLIQTVKTSNNLSGVLEALYLLSEKLVENGIVYLGVTAYFHSESVTSFFGYYSLFFSFLQGFILDDYNAVTISNNVVNFYLESKKENQLNYIFKNNFFRCKVCGMLHLYYPASNPPTSEDIFFTFKYTKFSSYIVPADKFNCLHHDNSDLELIPLPRVTKLPKAKKKSKN